MTMSQQQQSPVIEDEDPIDYLAINRARWDERAPHVRIPCFFTIRNGLCLQPVSTASN
jgi:hypothetical protein